MKESHLDLFDHRVTFCIPDGESLTKSAVTYDRFLGTYSIDVMDSGGTVLCRFYKPWEETRLFLTYPRVTRILGGRYVRIIKGTMETHEPVEYLDGIVAFLLERKSSREIDVTIIV